MGGAFTPHPKTNATAAPVRKRRKWGRGEAPALTEGGRWSSLLDMIDVVSPAPKTPQRQRHALGSVHHESGPDGLAVQKHF